MQLKARLRRLKTALPAGRWRLATLGIFSLIAASYCHRAQRPAEPVQALISSQAPMALWVPDLLRASQQADAYVRALTQRAGAGAVAQWRRLFIAQLGFDPQNPEAVSKAGLRPGGAVLWREPGFLPPLLALPCDDCRQLERTIEGIVARREGTTKLSRGRRPGGPIQTLERPFGQATVALVHWTQRRGYLVVTAADGLAALQACLARWDLSRSAASGDAPARLDWPDLQALPEATGYLAVLGPATSPVSGAQLGPQKPPCVAPPSARLSAAWRWDAQGLTADMWLRDAHLDRADLTSLFGGAPIGPLGGAIAPDAWALWLTRGAGGDIVRQSVRHVPPRLRQLGFDQASAELLGALNESITPTLAGPLAIGVFPRDHADLGQFIRLASRPADLDLPMELAAVAEVADPALAAAALGRLPARLAPLRLNVSHQNRRVAGRLVKTYALLGRNTSIEWALWDTRLVVGLGAGRLVRTLSSLAAGPSPLAQAAPQSVLGLWRQTPGALFVLRAETIGRSLETMTRGLNTDGADAAGLGAVVSGIADVLITLGDIAVGIAQAPDALDSATPASKSTTQPPAPLHVRLRQQMH